MRQFIVTSTKFKGQAVLLYNDKEVVCMIDLQQTNMDAENT